MEIEKLRNLNEGELERQQRQTSEQLFRLRFQMKLGQNEGVKKLKALRKDVARIKTIARERELGIRGDGPRPAPGSAANVSPAGGVKKSRRAGKEAL